MAHADKGAGLMLYLTFKAIHILAMVVWLGGMLLLAAVIPAISSSGFRIPTLPPKMLQSIRKWDLKITAPAMALTWTMGLSMAGMGHLFGSGWLHVKLPLAFLLAGLYGVQSGSLQRAIDRAQDRPPLLLKFTGLLTVGSAAIAICMAVLKPF
jgi:putative membrane protein